MFLSTNKCQGLGECIKQCPTEAIRLINNKAFSCITCGICYQECPNHAIFKNEYGGYVVDRIKCNGCGVCQFNCPINNIKIDEEGMVKGICSRCGRCVDACGINARVDGFDLIKEKQLNYLKSLDAILPSYNTHNSSNSKEVSRLSLVTKYEDCTLCGRCEYYCPTNAIKLRVDKARGICNNCNVCEDVCPTGAMKDTIINHDYCSLCLNCLKSCPNEAILVDNYKINIIKLDQKNDGSIVSCINCGLCDDVSDTESFKRINGKLRYDPSSDVDTLVNFNQAIELCPTSSLHINSNGIIMNNTQREYFLEGYCTMCGNCVKVCENKARIYKTITWDGKANSNCISCGTCAEVCPKNAIMLKKDGIEVNLDECILCETCGIYCPADAIEKSTLAKKIVIDGFNNVDSKLCIYCKLCYDICKQDAIIDNGDSVSVDDEKCIKCGACKNICPSNAFIFDRNFVNKNKTVGCFNGKSN
ncbi:4Fe-4S binding protein [Methanobrevibacter sp.]